MVYSMTGFATTTCELHADAHTLVHATMTIKTLNSKFFEVTCRLPHLLAPLEPLIIQRCRDILKRGSVTVTLYLSNASALRAAVVPALNVVNGYMQAIQVIQRNCGISGEVQMRDLLLLPGVFEISDSALNEHMSSEILSYALQLIEQVVQARALEGISLQKDLEYSIEVISTCVEQLGPRAAQISEERRNRFLQEVQQLLVHSSQEVQALHIQAVYQQINAIDTHEEIIRIRAHCANFMATLRHDGDVQKGKKLDFILQEMLRETNTLNAKLADAASIECILTIKTKVEHAREQVQNLV